MGGIGGGEGAEGLDSVSVDGQLVGSEGPLKVPVLSDDASQLLNQGDTGDDDLVLVQLLDTDRESDGQDGERANEDTTNEDEDLVKITAVW